MGELDGLKFQLDDDEKEANIIPTPGDGYTNLGDLKAKINAKADALVSKQLVSTQESTKELGTEIRLSLVAPSVTPVTARK